MSQTFQSTEGVILRVIPFRDYDHILFIFTLESGLIKVFHKGSRNQRQRNVSFCMPLIKVEVVYFEQRGEIFGCQEIRMIDSFSLLRKEFLFLEVACDLLQALLVSQLPEKSAPELYALLSFYLKKIPLTEDPWVLAASFRLKLLYHDGLLALPFHCDECHLLLDKEAFTHGSTLRCFHHRFEKSQTWEQQELEVLNLLVYCQNYKQICSENLSLDFRKKISYYFESCIIR